MKDTPLQSVGFWARRILVHFECLSEKSLGEFGIGLGGAIILKILFFSGPKSLIELAKKLSFAHPSVLRHIDQLENRGYVSRVPHPGDRRVKLIELTAEGKKTVPLILAILKELNNKAMVDFNESEREQFFTLTGKICENLSAHETC